MKRDFQQITNALRAVRMPVRQQDDYPATNANVAYLLYDIGTERNLPERSIYDILGYRGYLYVAKTRYYATPEGKQVLEEALAMLDESEVSFRQILIPPPLGSPCKQGEPFLLSRNALRGDRLRFSGGIPLSNSPTLPPYFVNLRVNFFLHFTRRRIHPIRSVGVPADEPNPNLASASPPTKHTPSVASASPPTKSTPQP